MSGHITSRHMATTRHTLPSAGSDLATFTASFFRVIGWGVISISLLSLLYFTLAYDPTVLDAPQALGGTRVYHIGRMHNQLIGVLGSLGVMGFGIFLARR